jgi:hypothetical protein
LKLPLRSSLLSLASPKRLKLVGLWMIIAGLIGEAIVIVFVPSGPFEKILSVIFTLIIALGVWVEEVAGEAIEAREKAEADLKIAELNARVAEANQKAQEASLELAKFRSPRSVTNEKSEEMAAKLRRFSGTPYDMVVSSNDSEISAFLLHIRAILDKAGWTALPWDAPSQVIRPIIGPTVGIGISVSNVFITADFQGARILVPAAQGLAEELRAIGIEASAGSAVVMGVGMSKNNAVHIMIGRKM